MNNHYIFNGHTFDFSYVIPKIDGDLMRNKSQLIETFLLILRESGYEFDPFYRPMPAIYRNIKHIDFIFVRKWIVLVLKQLAYLPLDILPLCVLDIDGFSLKDNRLGENHRLVHVDLIADNYKSSSVVSFDNVGSIVNRFMSMNFTNKKCIIS